jgi:hypothetical protein
MLIDWADALCGDWGRAMHYRMVASGYPTEAAISRALQGRGGFVQHFPEVMLAPDVRACNEAIRELEARGLALPHAVAWGKYVFRLSVRRASAALDVSTADYRAAHVVLNTWVAAKVERVPVENLAATA